MPDPLWRACLDAVRRRLGNSATQADLLWSTAISYLFATGELAESNVSASIH